MNEVLEDLLFFTIVFIVVFVFCYFIAGRIKPKSEKGKKSKPSYKMMSEGKFLILQYHLDESKINLKQFNFGICVCNAFIISLTSTIICKIPLDMIYQLMIGFVLVFGLIYAVFELYGRYLNKKWGKK